jgi:hypothetical protein
MVIRYALGNKDEGLMVSYGFTTALATPTAVSQAFATGAFRQCGAFYTSTVPSGANVHGTDLREAPPARRGPLLRVACTSTTSVVKSPPS